MNQQHNQEYKPDQDLEEIFSPTTRAYKCKIVPDESWVTVTHTLKKEDGSVVYVQEIVENANE